MGSCRAGKGLPASSQERGGIRNRACRFSLWEKNKIKPLNSCKRECTFFVVIFLEEPKATKNKDEGRYLLNCL